MIQERPLTTTPEGRAWLIDLLHNYDVSLKFIKADGTERTMKCTLREGAVVPHEKKTDREKQANDNVLPVWDLDKGAWRSFRLDSITDVNAIEILSE